VRAKQAEAVAAWENPLIPNARLRQIYLAMARARTLAKAMPTARRGQTIGLEAALVSATVDLGPGDLVSDALTGGVVEGLRGARLDEALRTGKAADSRRQKTSVRGRVRGGSFHKAECGGAGRLIGLSDAAERIWAAMGAAAALKTATAQARIEAKVSESEAAGEESASSQRAGVVVFYALPGELSAALWKKALSFAAEQELPLVFVLLPAARVRSGKARATKVGGVSALALGCGVPAIAVDADDAVAIYRVAQESVGHARIGGGAALIECVPFVIQDAASKHAATKERGATSRHAAANRHSTANDAIAELERYLMQRGIASKTWMEREARLFAQRVEKAKAGSIAPAPAKRAVL
jgi:TPP-dependent pyruvate/acetoin dehydrogenase alpha subunit